MGSISEGRVYLESIDFDAFGDLCCFLILCPWRFGCDILHANGWELRQIVRDLELCQKGNSYQFDIYLIIWLIKKPHFGHLFLIDRR